jgi:phage tail-like protein
MADRYPYNIPAGFHFDVIVKGYESPTECVFSEVSGLNAKMETENVGEGGINNYLHKLPKKVSYENLVLKRGLMKGTDLITWVNNAVKEFRFEPKTVLVRLLDENNQPTVNWNITNAYPVAIRTSDFKAMENAIVFETFELAYEYFTREEK